MTVPVLRGCKGWLRTCRECGYRFGPSPKDGKKILVVENCPECGQHRGCRRKTYNKCGLCNVHGGGTKTRGTRPGRPKTKARTSKELLLNNPLKEAIEGFLENSEDLINQKEIIAINLAMMAKNLQNMDLGTIHHLTKAMEEIVRLTEEPYRMASGTKSQKDAVAQRVKLNFIKIGKIATSSLDDGKTQLAVDNEFRAQARLNKELVDSVMKTRATSQQMLAIEVVLQLIFGIIFASEQTINHYVPEKKKVLAANAFFEQISPIIESIQGTDDNNIVEDHLGVLIDH